MNSLHLPVTGVNNNQMKTSLKNALEKIDGVQRIGVDMELGLLEIGFNPPASESQIRACVVETGFKLE